MRILLAGDWHSELHEEAAFRGFRELGQEVARFSWHEYFRRRIGALAPVTHLLQRAQNRFLAGPLLARLNRDFVAAAAGLRPDMVFVYRGSHITRASLRLIRRDVPGAVLVGYNNDDPFAPGQLRWLWRHFLDALPEYDLVLAYRHRNLDEFRAAGARRVQLLRSWYDAGRHHPVTLTPAEEARFGADVVFVGHYEPDERTACLEEIVQHGVRLRLFGPGYDWDPIIARSAALRHLAPVSLVWGEDYNRALCGAKIALCFLSRLNRDTYTRRCFEIPATRTLMLAEYTDDLAGLFREGEEADFFRSPDELVRKIRLYLDDRARRAAVAAAGYERVRRDGHDVVSRMREVIGWVDAIRREAA